MLLVGNITDLLLALNRTLSIENFTIERHMTDKMLFHRPLPTRSASIPSNGETNFDSVMRSFFVGMLLIKITPKQVEIEQRHGKFSFLDKQRATELEPNDSFDGWPEAHKPKNK